MVDIVPNKIKLKFHEKVRKDNFKQLGNLFFFNENQSRYYNKIIGKTLTIYKKEDEQIKFDDISY